MSDEEQKLRVRLVGRNGRRRYDPGSKERLVAACLQLVCQYQALRLRMGSMTTGGSPSTRAAISFISDRKTSPTPTLRRSAPPA